MQLRRTYRFRLEPARSVGNAIGRIAGSCRFVFNRALAMQRERLERHEKRLGFAALCRELTSWRHAAGMEFLADAPVHPLQQSLMDLDRAYRNFFEGRAEPPRFRKKGRRDAFRYPDPSQFAIDDRNGRVKLPKLGWVPYRASRRITGSPRQLTIAREGRHWFLSVQTEESVEAPVHPAKGAVGVDLGVTRFAALSTGETFAPVSSLARHQRKMAREQRALARKVKFGRNWTTQKARIQRLHLRIARIRKDFLHKTSTAISKNHAMVVLEDLAVKSMTRSARGTQHAPGRNVRARARLNASILDQGWGEFRRQLEYKQAWRGGQVVVVDPRNTSRTCPECGHVAAANRRSQAEFRCVRCGYGADADVNAARNILAAGHAVIACGEAAQSGHSTKQEPTVSTGLPLV